ncbi:MAG: TonB-dependent receptor [Bacteroidales bacterium]|nr:TonB-dependent receptor [Bacteroidales bacterium]
MKRILTALAVLLAACVTVFAQGGYQVKGVVEDAIGPVIGASVIEQGTTNGVSTGLDGDFAITVSGPDAVIEISCIGYATLRFPANAVPEVITLTDDSNFLDEVVVIGYGTVKKGDMTGSVSTVRADQVNKGIATSPAQLLSGKAGGVVVTAGDGAPGSGSTIRIRGGSSLTASNDPLIIVDGLPVGTHGVGGMADALASINPDDIESFTVLKDASATAIYGSRASNGVILITTRTGKKSDGTTPKVNIDFTTSLSQNAKYMPMLTGNQMRELMLGENGYIATRLASEIDRANAIAGLGNANTDWQKAIYQTGTAVEGNIGVTGNIQMGEHNYLPYRVSGGVLLQNGTLKTSQMDRGTLSVNLNPSFLDNHLKFDLSAKGSYVYTRFANTGAIGAAVVFNPTQPIYDPNGVNGYFTIKNSEGGTAQLATMNPVAALDEYNNKNYALRFIGNAQVDYSVHGLEDLHLHVNLGIDSSSSNGLTIVPAGSEQSFHDQANYGLGSRHPWNEKRTDKTLEIYANYMKDFGKHNVGAMAGYSWQEFKNHSWGETTSADGTKVISEADNYDFLYRLISFFGRVNYSFDGRYLITATVRADGTSRFVNNKWGIFPSVALAWNAKNEAFLKDVGAVTAAKLRLSWGQTGQQELNAGDYPSLPTYTYGSNASMYYFGNRMLVPITPQGYNADLKWETTTTYNAGVDFGFWQDRITGNLDFYYRKTTDLLNKTPIPAGANLKNELVANIGTLVNKGVELDLNYIAIQKQDIFWQIGFNVAYNDNRVTKLTAYDSAEYKGVPTGDIAGAVGNKIQRFMVGEPVSTFYVYKQVYDVNGHPIPGLYADINNSGAVDEDDMYCYKKPAPTVTFGLSTNFNWKNWTLAVSAHANLGNYVYNNNKAQLSLMSDLWTNNFTANRIDNVLVEPFYNKDNIYFSDYFIENASFLKVDNVTLGYNFKNLLEGTHYRRSEPIHVNGVSGTIFFTVQNLLCITRYSGIDPEVFGGIDSNVYPRPRNFMLGLKLNF